MRSLINVMRNNFRYLFASKKNKQSPQVLKLSRSKLNDLIGGHLIYKTDQFGTIFTVAMSTIAALSIFGFFAYSYPMVHTIVPTAIMFFSAAHYQRRISNTAKQIIVQKSGEQLKIITYGAFGSNLFHTTYLIPIYIFRGVSHTKITKAIVIRGGGLYEYRKFSFYFRQAGVLDKKVFDTVVGGLLVKYVDNL